MVNVERLLELAKEYGCTVKKVDPGKGGFYQNKNGREERIQLDKEFFDSLFMENHSSTDEAFMSESFYGAAEFGFNFSDDCKMVNDCGDSKYAA